ncbi:MAG: ABC transporter ATP-binding protein [Desulfobulbaceae bacterium]|nr:ABC transporter ATP-binding protein [Desulfobulbaceae bacterium]
MNTKIDRNDDQSSLQNPGKEENLSQYLPKPSVVLENVSLCYQRGASFFLSKNRHLREKKKFWALRDVNLTLFEGETIGLIGRNGSGKSTISMIISGSLKPDNGTVTVHGRVQLLALGIGFRPTMTGRENVIISGSILGLSRREIKEKMDEIEDFAELGEFFDEPVKIYSAGMRSRLGFAVSTAVNPDILILDEVMSTGDASFRKKANERMNAMRERTKTVIIVSHNPAQLREQCSRVVWLDKGYLLMDGSVEDVLPVYEEFCQNPGKWRLENKNMFHSPGL